MFQKTKSIEEIKQVVAPVQNVNVQRKEKLSITDKIALWITNKVGTFGFFVFCCILTITPLVVPSLMTVIMFISSSFLQLVLLPLIIIGQNLQSAHSEARAEEDYEVNKKAELEVETILMHLENQNEIIKQQGEQILLILQKLEAQGSEGTK